MTEQNSPEWEPPPPPPSEQSDPPQMSEVAALGNVFIEPGKVFEDMRRKPRFLLASLITIVIFTLFQVVIIEKVGLENIVRARIEASKSARDLATDQKEAAIKQQSGPIVKIITYIATPISIVVMLLIGGLLYWGLGNAMGGSGSFMGGLTVFAYSGVPPGIVFFLANLIVLFLKSADELDLAHIQGGPLKASLAFFIDPNSSPLLFAFLGAFDLFTIWGWILAAIGLQRVAKLSSGAAWAVVLIVGSIGIILKTLPGFFS